MTEGIVDFSEWEKLDLRVGQIEKVEDIEGADKLYKLSVDIGDEMRIVCAGLKEHYSKEELEGKKIILFVNLAPRKMRGIESQGMILACVSSEEGSHPPTPISESQRGEAQKEKVVLISPENDIEVGSRVR